MIEEGGWGWCVCVWEGGGGWGGGGEVKGGHSFYQKLQIQNGRKITNESWDEKPNHCHDITIKTSG